MQKLLPLALLALACRSHAHSPGGQETERDPRVIHLFDGKTLDGWVDKGGHYDGTAQWTVENGCIVGRTTESGEGGLLYTAAKYAAFDLELDTQIDYPFDSGIFLRMAPEGRGAQLTLDHREGGEIGAIYSDGFLAHNEQGAALFKRGEWNHVRVRCTGFDMHIEAWLNEKKLIDYRVPDGERGFAQTGLIGIQVHGGGSEGPGNAARFKNLRLRELPIFGEQLFTAARADKPELLRLSAAAEKAGWKPLFDGTSLAGLRIEGDAAAFLVHDGEIRVPANAGGGHLYTESDYQDFRLRLDFKVPKVGNSGVFLRASRDGANPAFSGCEVQILDDFNWERANGSTLQDWQFTGSLYGSVPPGDRTALRPIGAWNTYEILYKGERLAVALNGNVLYDVRTSEVPLNDHPSFAERAASGFIGLQAHGSEHAGKEDVLSFRNLFVQPLAR